MAAVLISYFLYFAHIGGLFYTGIDSFGYVTQNSNLGRYGATSIAVMSFSFLSLLNLYIICRPLTKYRCAVVIGAAVVTLVAYIIIATAGNPRNILGLDFSKITYENYIVVAAIFISVTAIRLFISSMHAIRKEYHKEND